MPKLTAPIPPQAFELLRNRIAEILKDEIEGQMALQPTFRGAEIYVDQAMPFDVSSLPAVNVSLSRGEYDHKSARNTKGTYTFNIDCFERAMQTSNKAGAAIVSDRLCRLTGIIRAILENPVYNTLGVAAGVIMHTSVASISFGDVSYNNNTQHLQAGQIAFNVDAIEGVQLQTFELLDGYDTTAHLELTDNGYVWKYSKPAEN